MSQANEHVFYVQQLFVKHQRSLRAYVLSLCPNFALADDILQEVFLVVTQKACQFESGTDFLAWARTIAQFKVFEARRKHLRSTIDANVLSLLAEQCPSDWASDARVAALAKCLPSLAPKAQELIRLRYEKEWSPVEIAMHLSRTVNSVSVALAKARVALRDCVSRQLARREAT